MRYALFYTPPVNHGLTQIAAEWLGRDAYSGVFYKQPVHGTQNSTHPSTLSADRLADLTTAPRRYGFHGTLKAPFHLSEDQGEDQLVNAMKRFCKSREAFAMPRLKVGRLGHFFALVPDSNASELSRFAAEIVRYFDIFRAPLSEADYARRNPDRLEEQQRAYLQQWGYPYIFDAFRFHMTLTGAVPDAEADQMEDILKALFDPLLRSQLMCDHLTLFCEVEKGAPFIIHTAIPLGPLDPLGPLASSPNTKAQSL